jgi:hypothetical protein
VTPCLHPVNIKTIVPRNESVYQTIEGSRGGMLKLSPSLVLGLALGAGAGALGAVAAPSLRWRTDQPALSPRSDGGLGNPRTEASLAEGAAAARAAYHARLAAHALETLTRAGRE